MNILATRLYEDKDFPSRDIQFSFLIMIFLISFLVRKCQSKDNDKSCKLFSDESAFSQLHDGMYT